MMPPDERHQSENQSSKSSSVTPENREGFESKMLLLFCFPEAKKIFALDRCCPDHFSRITTASP
jgi:hypothetical protein